MSMPRSDGAKAAEMAWLVYIEASICKSWIMFSSWALALSRWASVT
jgi:hypothetical protein